MPFATSSFNTTSAQPLFTRTLLSIALSAALGITSTSFSSLTLAQTQSPNQITVQQEIQLPAGPLGRSLSNIAVNAGIALSFNPALTKGLSTPAVSGNYQPLELIKQLAAQHQLKLVKQDDGSYTLIRQNNSMQQLDELTVIEKIHSGEYRNDFADSATKTYTYTLDIPQPVDVINQELLQGQMALDLDDIYRNAASVNIVDPLGHTNIRGFRLNENSGGVLKNGLREVSQGFTFPPLANIEKVEILKGASSALYGRGEPGGIINLITKKPQNEDFTDLSVIAGSDDFYQFNLDHNTAINEDLQFRINVQLNDEGSYRDSVSQQRQFIAPAISYRINDTQKITAEFEFNQFKQTRDQGIAAIDDDISALPAHRYLGGDTDVDTHITTFQLTHEWFVDDNWALNSKFRIGHDDTDDALFNPFPANVQSALNGAPVWLGNTDPRLYRTFTTADDVKDELNLDINLTGEVDALGVEHSLLFGFNVNQRQVDRDEKIHYNALLRQTLVGVNPALANYSLASFIDPFDPQNITGITLPSQLAGIPGLGGTFDYTDQVTLNQFETDIISTGLYFQDQIRLNPEWKVTVGARYDHHEYDVQGQSLNTLTFAADQFAFNPIDDSQSKDTLAPKLGLVYSPQDNIALYASYGQQFDISLIADQARATESDAQEYGIKWDITDSLTASAAYFNIRKTDVLDVSSFSVTNVVDEIRSEGVELSLLGRLNPHWVVSANYSNYSAKITKDEDKQENEGNQARGTPSSSSAIWLQYSVEAQGATGLSVALGANYVGERPVDNGNSFDLPDYTLYDLMASYRFNKDLSLKLKVENLTDERWYAGSFTSQSVFVGHGTQAKLAVDYRF